MNSGVIVVNKPKGYTSRDIVNIVGKKLGTKKIGHTGTLDPLAEGVLVICFGQATKIVELLTATNKEYIAGVKLGIKTDTLDTEGTIVAEKEVPSDIDFKKVLGEFKKTYMQEVPIYSAIKVNGKKLYEYARRGEEVTLPKKEVTINEIELLDSNIDSFSFRVNVSKGCYIRSLIRDIGEYLNTYATMTSLIRTKQGTITLDKALNMDDIDNNRFNILSIEDVLDYPIITVSGDMEFKINNGGKINNIFNIKDKVIFKSTDRLLGIYEKEDNMLKCWKNFS